MIDFINKSLKIKELYIDTNVLNRIIESFKKAILDNKEIFIDLYNIDIKNCKQTIKIDSILTLLDLYKNVDIDKRREKDVVIVSYYGSPYITINLCIESLIQNRTIIALIEDSMIGVNKLLINVFNKVLKEYRINKMIELFNLIKEQEIKHIEKYVNEIICIGNTNTYYEYKKLNFRKIRYIPFRNMAIYCNDDEYLGIQSTLYEFAKMNSIETEIYEEDLDEFIDCVNLDNKLENIVVFSKSKDIIDKVKNNIKNRRIYVNENPFKEDNFKIVI